MSRHLLGEHEMLVSLMLEYKSILSPNVWVLIWLCLEIFFKYSSDKNVLVKHTMNNLRVQQNAKRVA